MAEAYAARELERAQSCVEEKKKEGLRKHMQLEKVTDKDYSDMVQAKLKIDVWLSDATTVEFFC